MAAELDEITTDIPPEKNKGGRPRGTGGSLSSPKFLEEGFRAVQRRVLDELRTRTNKSKLTTMKLDDLAKILRACNEHLNGIHRRKLTTPGDDKIEFVTVAPLEKK